MVVGEIARPVDVLVIGGGPGGYTAAARAAELGKEVVLVEDGQLGGVCLNVGCIPSKALITAASQHHRARTFAAYGIPTSDAPVDLAATQAWKRTVVDRLVGGVRTLLSGVEVVDGFARLLDDRRVSVESGDQVSHFQFDACILATGSRPIELPGLEVDGEQVVDSSGALAFEELPASLAVVGGGYIGLELGTAYAKLGVPVTIVEALDRIGTGFDPELVRVVERRLEQLGVTVLTGARAQRAADGVLTVTDADGAERGVDAQRVLVAVGRVPNTSELQLDNAGLELGPDGRIPVDAQQRTNARRIYAIGDLVAGPALAHKASTEGRVAAEAIAGLPSAMDATVPLIAFTDPELATVGMTEEEARAAGHDVVVGKARFSTSGRALTLDEPDGLVKLVIDREDEVVLGVHVVGPDASDLISEGAVLVECALRLDDVLGTIHPHPTLGESVHDAAVAARRRLAN
ncbi:MAG: dihydrolipoyl dehydrogenase [Nitriliruptoraceae bacterium]